MICHKTKHLTNLIHVSRLIWHFLHRKIYFLDLMQKCIVYSLLTQDLIPFICEFTNLFSVLLFDMSHLPINVTLLEKKLSDIFLLKSFDASHFFLMTVCSSLNRLAFRVKMFSQESLSTAEYFAVINNQTTFTIFLASYSTQH